MKLTAKERIVGIKKQDTVAIFSTEENSAEIREILPEQARYLLDDIDTSFFRGKESETLFIPLNSRPNLILCGLGKKQSLDSEKIRICGSVLAQACRDQRIVKVHLICPGADDTDGRQFVQSISEGMSLANYSFNRYKSDTDSVKPLIKEAVVYTGVDDAKKILRQVEIITENVKLCRDLVNETSDNTTPQAVAAIARKIAGNSRTSCTVYDRKQLEDMKMGLLLAVNRGSSAQPRLVVLRYNGGKKGEAPVALVGKGITFDSGGMNLKPSGHIETMRMDMAGAAAVMYTVKTAADLGLKKNICAVIPLTDNMLSSNSYRPGDVYTSFSGKTVEIGNTDAEGRLILADALAFTETKIKPSRIIDMATLTGACVVTFGETIAGYLTDNSELSDAIYRAGENTGEKVWRLPMDSGYSENIKSEIADINNISSEKNAGTIIGAVFLKNFVKDTPWAHIDIAGTAWSSRQRGYRPRYATGYGVRLLSYIIMGLDI